MPKVTPFLWLERDAEAAARFYVSLFPNSEVTGGEAAGPGGPPLTVSFKLDGVEFIALNGGPHFKLNEAFSMSVSCQDQAEIDRLWDALTADGGEPGRCGWLKDRFGVSWQIVPVQLHACLGHPDPVKAERARQAMFTMSKLDIAALEAAVAG